MKIKMPHLPAVLLAADPSIRYDHEPKENSFFATN